MQGRPKSTKENKQAGNKRERYSQEKDHWECQKGGDENEDAWWFRQLRNS